MECSYDIGEASGVVQVTRVTFRHNVSSVRSSELLVSPQVFFDTIRLRLRIDV